MNVRRHTVAALAAAALLLSACAPGGSGAADEPAAGTPWPSPPGPALTVEVVLDGLEHPWDVALTPEGTALVTERGGRLLAHDDRGTRQVEADLGDLFVGSEAGLMGLEVSPDFGRTREIFLCHATQDDGRPRDVRVTRWRLDDGAARAERTGTVVDGLPISSGRHSGCRLRFAPDGTLRVGTGDAARGENPQDPGSLGGKTLRLNPDGTVPQDNPFASQPGALSEIWDIGHRNIQSSTFDDRGRLWTVEHGAKGGDELNLIVKGKNYGWPIISYGEEYSGEPIPGNITAREGLEQPVYYWDPVIAPSGMQYYTGSAFPAWRGSIFVGGLASQKLVRLVIKDDRVTGEEHLLTERGQRIRDVRQGPDGNLYIVTDDSNGELLRISPRK